MREFFTRTGKYFSGKRLRVQDFGVIAVAINALRGSILINHDGFIGDQFGLSVTLVTGHIGMAPGKCEVSPGIVVEGGRHPALGIVAISAVSSSVLGQKLRIVGIVVASLALLRGALES